MPDFVGMVVGEAVALGHASGVVVTSSAVDGPPLAALTWPGLWLVDSQMPSPGTVTTRGSIVQVSFVRGGGDAAGDCEPRLPPAEPPHVSVETEVGA